MRTLRLIAVVALLATSAFAVEVAELRNGFTIAHRSRQSIGPLVRLYLDDSRRSFVDVPAAEVVEYRSEPDPPPLLAAPAAEPAAPPKSTGQIVEEASAKHGVDSDFIFSVIQQESAGNARAVSHAGARGLMQLMPQTASELGVKDVFSPEQNVHGGTQYLRQLLERYGGDAIKALAAYNAGPAAVDRYHGVPPYRETRQYVSRVVGQYNRAKNPAAKPQSAAKPASPTSAPTAKPAPKVTSVPATPQRAAASTPPASTAIE